MSKKRECAPQRAGFCSRISTSLLHSSNKSRGDDHVIHANGAAGEVKARVRSRTQLSIEQSFISLLLIDLLSVSLPSPRSLIIDLRPRR
jgi:hypothetical protein